MAKTITKSTSRALRNYFRACFVVVLMAAVGAGLILTEDGTQRVESGDAPESIAVLQSDAEKVQLLFPNEEMALSFHWPDLPGFVELLPSPLSNVVWLGHAVMDAIAG
ncbi:MAG: hypothetical protein LBN05_03550 [Oscillospiraceae bacterium]|jgi:hypothetical protein|nr:hypothetical protein [Oscillospiraceae bacterium]